MDGAGEVESVTQMCDVIYILCQRSSTVLRFTTSTHQRLQDIDVLGVMSPHDIAACEQTSQLYVADFECIWRVSADGADIRRWLPSSPTSFLKPWTISVTSARLLVTSPEVRQLIQFDSDGDELRRVQLPDSVALRHAVESPTGAFIVSLTDRELDQDLIREINTEGEVLRQFGSPSLRWPDHLTIDSHGNIFVTDAFNCHILLFSSHLALRRVIVDERQLNSKPVRGVCYLEKSGRLLVPSDASIAMFDVLGH